MSVASGNVVQIGEQVGRLVAENQNLRVKSNNDDTMIHLLQQQYATLSAEVDSIRDVAARRETKLRTERDMAVAQYQQIDGLLMQAADLLMQAFRAREGDKTPEKMPVAVLPGFDDARLPGVALS